MKVVDVSDAPIKTDFYQITESDNSWRVLSIYGQAIGKKVDFVAFLLSVFCYVESTICQ